MGNKKGETFPTPHAGNGSKDSQWWSSALSLTILSWRNTMVIKILDLGV
jgi:hypothetical protein